MCKNEYRRHNLRQSSKSALETETYQPDMDHKNFQNVLLNVLNHVNESDRNLFIMKYELEMPLSEIASIMDCPEGDY